MYIHWNIFSICEYKYIDYLRFLEDQKWIGMFYQLILENEVNNMLIDNAIQNYTLMYYT